ncbi:uncharacterized protein LOC141850980 [Brevipalpus obovatus]|uniref:uncharacterized protein LOC141850980 n=1 Tax=Brevipalpus obovatus TaxID=246614 RepID=UPI003D9F498C
MDLKIAVEDWKGDCNTLRKALDDRLQLARSLKRDIAEKLQKINTTKVKSACSMDLNSMMEKVDNELVKSLEEIVKPLDEAISEQINVQASMIDVETKECVNYVERMKKNLSTLKNMEE